MNGEGRARGLRAMTVWLLGGAGKEGRATLTKKSVWVMVGSCDAGD